MYRILLAKVQTGTEVVTFNNDLIQATDYQLSYLTDLEFDNFLEDVKTAFADEQTRIYELKL